MGKKQQKVESQKKNAIIQPNVNVIDEITMTQAIVKAYEIIEEKRKFEETKCKEQKDIDKKNGNEKWYIKVLFMLNVLFFPWKINKRFTINNQIYDSILVFAISLVLVLIGMVVWIIELCVIVYEIICLCQSAVFGAFVGMLVLGIVLMLLGSLFILASDEFSKVSDSNKIYAYSASVIALISCVVAVLSLIKQ